MSIRLQCLALMLMLCLWITGCTPTAETQLDEQRNPHYLAGKEKLGALDFKGAIESFERAVEDNPRSAFAHFELGVLYEQKESDYAAALYHYNKALKLRPNGHPAEIIRQRIPGCKQELVSPIRSRLSIPTCCARRKTSAPKMPRCAASSNCSAPSWQAGLRRRCWKIHPPTRARNRSPPAVALRPSIPVRALRRRRRPVHPPPAPVAGALMS